MPPKVTDTRTAQNEALHKVEEKTAAGARRIVATFAEDFYDAVTLMCMLGVEKEGLSFKISAGNVLTLSPPLIIDREDLDRALAIVERAVMAG